jgi:hypothetical protein
MGASFVSDARAACRDCANAQGVRTSNPIVEQAVESGALLWRRSPHDTWTARNLRRPHMAKKAKKKAKKKASKKSKKR